MSKCPECKHEIHDDRDSCDLPICGDGCCHCTCGYRRPWVDLIAALDRKKDKKQAIAALKLREMERGSAVAKVRKLEHEARLAESELRRLRVTIRSQERTISRLRAGRDEIAAELRNLAGQAAAMEVRGS